MATNFDDLTRLFLSLKSRFFEALASLSQRINERFDNLPPQKRSLVVLSSLATLAVVFGLIILLYVSGLQGWQNRLDKSYETFNELQFIKAGYLDNQTRFSQLTENIQNANQAPNVIEILAKKADELGIEPINFPNKPLITDLPENNILGKQFQLASVEFSASNVSLKKIMEYIEAVESMPNHFSFNEVKIQQILDTKLYFDVHFVISYLSPYQTSSSN